MDTGVLYVPFDLCKLLYGRRSFYAWVNHQRISSEVVERYGELTDDGYYELTEEGGGSLKWSEVYESYPVRVDSRTVESDAILCYAPSYEECIRWFLEDRGLLLRTNLRESGWGWSLSKVSRLSGDSYSVKELGSLVGFRSEEAALYSGMAILLGYHLRTSDSK